MDQASQFMRSNSSLLSTVAFLVVIVLILYVVYTYLYPAMDANYTRFIDSQMNAMRPIPVSGQVPAIFTGGDFTLSMWIYIDNWNYKVSDNKFLFAISPDPVSSTANSPLVGILTPLQNGLMVRANTVQGQGASPAGGAMPAGAGSPDITKESALQALLKQQTSMQMFGTTVADVPCDIKEVPLQKWVCITIVSSGRVLDVYMDGKLSRSCVLPNVLSVPNGKLKLRLGESGGFGGSYSTVQMWNQQLTPDLIYGIYQMGPTQVQHSIISDLASWIGINVSFTGPSPGTSVAQAACSSQGPSGLSALVASIQGSTLPSFQTA